MSKTLITYASKHGQTAKIALHIAERMRAHGGEGFALLLTGVGFWSSSSACRGRRSPRPRSAAPSSKAPHAPTPA